MEIGQYAAQKGTSVQHGQTLVDVLTEGQVFSGKAVKMLPGQKAELAALGQRLTAQLEVPLQAGERYFFQVTSMDKGIQLSVLPNAGPVPQRPADQAAFLLNRLQLPASPENITITSMALENKAPLSKESIQLAGSWLAKTGLSEGTEALRFMVSRSLPMTEPVFQSLVAARSADSLTGKMAAFQSMISSGGENGQRAAAMISRLLEGHVSSGPFQGTANEKAVQLAHALGSSSESLKTAAAEVLIRTAGAGEAASAANSSERLAALGKAISSEAAGPAGKLSAAVVQLASGPFGSKEAAAFKEAVSLSIPLQHPGRLSIMQEVSRLLSGLPGGKVPEAKAMAGLVALAAQAAVAEPDQAAAQMAQLLGADKLDFAEEKAALPMREAFRFLGIDHEAGLAARSQEETSVKQELLKLMTDSMPAPVREAAEQIVGRLNAQHILSAADSGPLQQLVMQAPMQFGEFRGDVTIKWQGKKKPDGKIDADFCRVLFYVEMPNLQNTIIDMQVQSRIVNVTLIAEAPAPLLKEISGPALDSLKAMLEQGGYRLSGVYFKEPVEQEKTDQNKPPLARIMDDKEYLGVDIRI